MLNMIFLSFSGILKRIIYDTVASMMVLPNKLAVKLSEEVDTMELKTPEPEVSFQNLTPKNNTI